jgi:hypothetical protein
MRTLSLEFLSMMISTPLASWSAGINRRCEVCFANLPALMLLWPMISPRKHFCVLTKTSGAFAARRVFPRGFIGSRIIVSGKMHAAGKSWLGLTRSNGERKATHRQSILV